jgi:hypothetical protein
MSYPEDNLKGAKGVPIKQQPNQRKGGGRKPKLVRKWVKEINISKADVQAIIKSVLFTRSFEETVAELKESTDSVSVATYAMLNAVKNAAQRGDHRPIIDLLEFGFGKADQQITVNDDRRLVDLAGLLEEKAGQSAGEKERIITELEKAANETVNETVNEPGNDSKPE